MEATETLAGKRGWAQVDLVDISEAPQGNQEERCRVGGLHATLVADLGVVENLASEHAQWHLGMPSGGIPT